MRYENAINNEKIPKTIPKLKIMDNPKVEYAKIPFPPIFNDPVKELYLL